MEGGYLSYFFVFFSNFLNYSSIIPEVPCKTFKIHALEKKQLFLQA